MSSTIELPMWRWWEANARIRHKAINNPTIWRARVRTALKRLGCKYKEVVPVWNPEHKGKHNNLRGGYQWLDFVFRTPNGLFAAIIFDVRTHSGPMEYERRYIQTKEELLTRRNIPYLKLNRNLTSQTYEILIYRLIRKHCAK